MGFWVQRRVRVHARGKGYGSSVEGSGMCTGTLSLKGKRRVGGGENFISHASCAMSAGV